MFWVLPQALPRTPPTPIAFLITQATLSASVVQRERPWARGGDLPDSATPAVTITLPAASSAVADTSYESNLALRCCRRWSEVPGRRTGDVIDGAGFPGGFLEEMADLVGAEMSVERL